MTRVSFFGIFVFIVACLGAFAGNAQAQGVDSRISVTFDSAANRTTVRLAPIEFATEHRKYHSLKFSVFYSYPGKSKRVPELLRFELLTVVKASKLDPDLFVVFVADGEDIFLSSDRSAVLNPVRGKRWIGERLVFRLPYETFLKFARAKSLAVKLDGVQFDFGATSQHSLREFARHIKE